jgi:hypothetical protein
LCCTNVDIPYLKIKIKVSTALRRVTQVSQVTAQGVKLFKLSCAAPVNYGDGPKFLHIFTTRCIDYSCADKKVGELKGDIGTI